MRLLFSARFVLLAAAAFPAQAQMLPYHFEDVPEAETPASGPRLHYALLDRFEYAGQRGQDGYAWDFSALYGGDRNRIWLSSVGEGPAFGNPEYLEFQALYGRALGDSGWDLNAGLRYDAIPSPTRAYFVLGGQLTQEWDGRDFWLGTFAYLSHKGELSGRVGAIYNHALGSDFAIQPSFELNASAEDVPELWIGRGLTYAEAGLRLRYAASEKFAPYVGLSWSRSLGRTARIERAAGEDPETKSVVLGIRSGF